MGLVEEMKAKTKKTRMFAPADHPKSFIIKERLQGRSYNYNFKARVDLPLDLFNQRVIGRMFGRLHRLACHSPDPVAKKWRSAYNQFMDRYFANRGEHSVNFANTRTCHRFL